MRLVILLLSVSASTALASEPVYGGPDRGADKTTLTVADALEMRRLFGQRHNPISYSPDGKSYVVRLIKDDLMNDGIWLDVLAGKLESLEQASEPKLIAHLFTSGEYNPFTGRQPTTYPESALYWIDSSNVAFRWADGSKEAQVARLNVNTGDLQYLSNHQTSVWDFAVTVSGDVVYQAPPGGVLKREENSLSQGLVVKNRDALSTILSGYYSGEPSLNQQALYIQRQGLAAPTRISCRDVSCGTPWLFPVGSSSPNGRYLLTRHGYRAGPPAAWNEYTGTLKELVAHQRSHPSGISVSIAPLSVVDTQTAELRMLLDAPAQKFLNMNAVWSYDSSRVIVGPIALPIGSASEEGLAGEAIAEVDIATGAISLLTAPAGLRGKLRPIKWNRDGLVELTDGKTSVYYQKENGTWREVTVSRKTTNATFSDIEVRQGPNDPPKIYAIDRRTGQSKMIFDIEPRLRNFNLGQVKDFHWLDADGKSRSGRLFYPVNYTIGKKYPLVVALTMGGMTGINADRYTLFGTLWYDGPMLSAQAMAGRGMAVLTIGDTTVTLDEAETDSSRAAVESAIKQLEQDGLIDPRRVGVMGFSRNGWHTWMLLTQSQFPFAAAVISDAHNKTYTESVLKGEFGGEYSQYYGAEPFGAGLKAWLERSPGFNIIKIKTPVRIEAISGIGALINNWEMFARLDYLKKPVEMVLVPQPRKAVHALQIPSQKLFSQEGAVDWMDFWLNNREDARPEKAAQYQRWRELRVLQSGYNE